MDEQLEGPWPRMLTFAEIEQMKAHAMLTIEDKLVRLLENGPMNCGDSFVVSYTLRCGTDEEIKQLEKSECGAIPPNGGPPCKLQKGHTCYHSSVTRW